MRFHMIHTQLSRSISSFPEPRQIDSLRDVVMYPMAVPPFLGIDLDAVKLHREVNMIAACHSRHATLAHHFAPLHHVTFVHGDMAEMSIDCLQSVAMIHNDAVSIDA
jgi:hypothetical protein